MQAVSLIRRAVHDMVGAKTARNDGSPHEEAPRQRERRGVAEAASSGNVPAVERILLSSGRGRSEVTAPLPAKLKSTFTERAPLEVLTSEPARRAGPKMASNRSCCVRSLAHPSFHVGSELLDYVARGPDDPWIEAKTANAAKHRGWDHSVPNSRSRPVRACVPRPSRLTCSPCA